MNLLLKIYRGVIPEQIREDFNQKYQNIRTEHYNRHDMKRVSFGDLNKDKTFYVIRTDSTQAWGLGSTCTMVLNNIKYAIARGWIPIVDYKNYYLQGLQDQEKRGEENAWEYYFEQPVPPYTLDEVYRSSHVVLGPLRGQPYGSLSFGAIGNATDERYIEYFRLAEKYIRFNLKIRSNAEKMYADIFQSAKDKKVLGASVRAGLYWGQVGGDSSYAGHPKGISVSDFISLLYEYMQKFHCDRVFVSCDDRYYMEKIKREFGERCLYVPDRTLPHFFDMSGNPIMDADERCEEIAQQSIRERITEYAMEIILLSKCDSLIRTKGGAGELAYLLNRQKYEYTYLIYDGIIE